MTLVGELVTTLYLPDPSFTERFFMEGDFSTKNNLSSYQQAFKGCFLKLTRRPKPSCAVVGLEAFMSSERTLETLEIPQKG